jgi:hypothetical protein
MGRADGTPSKTNYTCGWCSATNHLFISIGLKSYAEKWVVLTALQAKQITREVGVPPPTTFS